MSIKLKSRLLRKSMTEAEQVLWESLRNHRFHGLQFRRQYPIASRYILDFYCAKRKLGIEIDGGIHSDSEIKENDNQRTKSIEAKGIRILRFKNSDVLQGIKHAIDSPSPR